MNRLAWKPWHEVVQLRNELKTGELSLSIFAADLYDVAMGRARPIYQNPTDFFSFTYPTFNLRELAKDVVLRLAGKNDKAVRQLELTYGGGKTHTLITLYHLTHQPRELPDLPAVQEFTQHIGMVAPRARVAVLAFDKLDAEKGMEISGPDGTRRWLKQPWSVLAYQLAGSDGLRLLHAEGADAERESAPAENLLAELLALPARHGLATLILIDEVLMYAREKVGLDPAWRGRLTNFFQYLTQAATKVETLRHRRLAARHRPAQKRYPRQGTDQRTVRRLPARARGERAAGSQRGRGRSAAAALLHAGVDPRSRGLSPARQSSLTGHCRTRRTDGQRHARGGRALLAELPVSSRPHRHLLHQVDEPGELPAHARRPAHLRPGPARRRGVGCQPPDRHERLCGPTRQRRALRVRPRVDDRGRDRRFRGPPSGMDGHSGRRTSQSARYPAGHSRAALPRNGAGGLCHLPALAAHRPGRQDARPAHAAGPHAAGQDRAREGARALDGTLLVPGRKYDARPRRRVVQRAASAQIVAARLAPEPAPDAPRRLLAHHRRGRGGAARQRDQAMQGTDERSQRRRGARAYAAGAPARHRR